MFDRKEPLENPKKFDSIYNIAKDETMRNGKLTFLLGKKINVNVTKDGVSPVEKLASEGNHAAVEFLLQHGANAQDACKGYATGGYFDNLQKMDAVFAKFKDSRTKNTLTSSLANHPVKGVIVEKFEIHVPNENSMRNSM